MRVYELAKEAGVTSADVLKAAEKAGVDASSAISQITADEAARVRGELAGADVAGVAAKRKAKAERAP